MEERRSGFYWVRFEDGREEQAEYRSETDDWVLPGRPWPVKDKDLGEIGEPVAR